MKLLLYSHYFAPSIGGVETIVMSLARGLAELRATDGAREFDLTLVTQTPRESFDDGGLPFRIVRRPGLWQLGRLVRNADALHIAGPALPPLTLGLLLGKPVVIEHHGFQVICPTGQMLIESRGEPCPGHFMAGRRSECWNCDPSLGWFGARKLWLLTFVRRWLCRRAAANIMPTNWLGEELKLPHASTIRHGLAQIDPPWKGEIQRAHPPVIAFQGRLVTTKGACVLLEAARILCQERREFELIFIGDGPERANLESRVEQPPLKGRVRFTGKLRPSELEAVLRQASMVVVPSLGGEVFGLVVAENMGRGLPIVASDLGSFVEVLGDTGVNFPTGNAAELATRISELLESPLRREDIGKREKERADQHFQISRMVREHGFLYQKVFRGAEPFKRSGHPR